MIYARVEDGWVRVPYSGPELARVEIGVGESEPTVWKPAFIHTLGDERVAQVRPVGMITERTQVWIKVGGTSTLVGLLGQAVPSAPGRRQRRG